jgi:subtilisin family serine protease
MKPRTLLRLAAVLSLALAPAFAGDIADSAKQQIAQIMAIKKTFSPAMQKMDSTTVFALLRSRGALPAWMNNIIDANNTGFVDVEIGANASPSFRDYVASLGGTIRNANRNNDVLIASIPLANLESIAARPEVKSVSRIGLFTLNAGALTSQGYISHRAKDAIAQVGVTGAGVKVGVISDSASAARVANLIASGDLPANTVVLAGQDGAPGTDEGTAMMEIVHDMAPGAQIYFATADNGGQAGFADNIRALAAAGCKVIVDDVTYYLEGVFQDGTVAKAVNDVTAAGVTYFSSAANDGNLTRGASGTWEGDFVDGGTVLPAPIAGGGETGNIQKFGADNFLTISAVASGIYSLKWSDPLGASGNDYDLFITNSAGTSLKAWSAASQTGTQDPAEILQSSSIVVGDKIVVVLYDGVARALHVGSHRGMILNGTSGATFGHNAAANAVSTAAVYWNSAFRGTVPFVGGASNPDEYFSSDGPRKIFYSPDGSPITPGNVLFGSNGGTTLVKPDLAGADGVSCRTPGFTPFYGTSAAAPHLAGIAALILQHHPTWTPAQVKAAMFNTAIDNMEAGIDRDSGHGIVNALDAVKYVFPPQ